VPVGADLAPPPGAYALVGAALGFAIDNRGESELQIGLEGSNLLNARYREYTSNLRYFADEPGRELRLRLGATF
jgi:iron complex outermembrane receptor protein